MRDGGRLAKFNREREKSYCKKLHLLPANSLFYIHTFPYLQVDLKFERTYLTFRLSLLLGLKLQLKVSLSLREHNTF